MQTNALHLAEPVEQEATYVLLKIAVVVCLAILAHFVVRFLQFISDWLIRKSAAKKSPVGFVTQQPKFITLTGLISGAFTLLLYAIALGFILHYLGMNPTQLVATYLGATSTIGFAVGFGSQGLIQDVITGLTLIFTDTLEVGDMVEVSGYIGRVQRVGLRFIELRNFLNQQVFLTNRNVSNFSRYPRDGVDAYMDMEIPAKAERAKVSDIVQRVAKGAWQQFPAIILREPVISDSQPARADTREFLRLHFKVWPGQGALIETIVRQRVIDALKQLDPNYADAMVVVTYRAIGLSGQASFSI